LVNDDEEKLLIEQYESDFAELILEELDIHELKGCKALSDMLTEWYNHLQMLPRFDNTLTMANLV
jgi:hypothetical protein